MAEKVEFMRFGNHCRTCGTRQKVCRAAPEEEIQPSRATSW
jgi:hypothetical protein